MSKTLQIVDKWLVFKQLENMGMSKGTLASRLGVCTQTVNTRWRIGWDKASLILLSTTVDIPVDELIKKD